MALKRLPGCDGAKTNTFVRFRWRQEQMKLQGRLALSIYEFSGFPDKFEILHCG